MCLDALQIGWFEYSSRLDSDSCHFEVGFTNIRFYISWEDFSFQFLYPILKSKCLIWAEKEVNTILCDALAQQEIKAKYAILNNDDDSVDVFSLSKL